MGLIKKLQGSKDGKKSVYRGWKLETESGADTSDFTMDDLQDLVKAVGTGEHAHLIVEGAKPVNRCGYMQLCPDNEGSYHFEVNIQKQNGYTLYGKDGLSGKQVMELLAGFVKDSAVPDINGWDVVMDWVKEGAKKIPAVLESIINRLDYSYHILSDDLSQDEVVSFYKEMLERGKRDGFVPVIVAGDEYLDEYLGIMRDDGYSIEQTLQKINRDGKEELDRRLRELEEDTELADLENMVGEISGGGAVDVFISLFTYQHTMTPSVLLEVPTQNPWEVVVYVPFGGWNECPVPEEMAAICRYWFEKYGAVPAVITHDTLEFLLPKPVPEEEALKTAKEHYAFCDDRVNQCTASYTLGEVADTIRQSKVWYFWWD